MMKFHWGPRPPLALPLGTAPEWAKTPKPQDVRPRRR